MSWQDIPMPKRIARLPKDHRGFPIPYVASTRANMILPPPWDPNYGEVAVEDPSSSRLVTLGHMAEQKQRRAFVENRCQVHGARIEGDKFLAGGLGTILEEGGQISDFAFREPWVCGECLVYALQVCPGLVSGARTGTLRVVKPLLYELLQERLDGSKKAFIAPLDYKPPRRISVCFYLRCRVQEGRIYTVDEFLEMQG